MSGKKLAYALRHAPDAFGIVLAADGSGELDKVSEALGLSVQEVEEIVKDDDKGRFVIQNGRIWAAQGHSIDVSVPLLPVTECGDLFHGTKQEVVRLILKNGLSPQSRLYVHLSPNVETAETVARRRKGESVLLRIDGQKLADSGNLFMSSNGVYLATHVPAELIRWHSSVK